MKKSVEVKDKYLLTVDEASDYFNLGVQKIREMTDSGDGLKCVLYNGKKRLIKRANFENYLSQLTEI